MTASSSTAQVPRPERLLEHYLRFILRDESGPLRERLQQGLVEHALKASNPEDESSASDLKKRIESLTRLPAYPQELVVQALNELVGQGRVDVVSDHPTPRCRLIERRRHAIDVAMNELHQQEESFAAGVLARIEEAHGKLDPSERELVEHAWRRLVGSILGSFGVHCARGLIEQRHWTGQADSYANLRSELSRSVAPLPEKLRKTTQAVFERTLRNPTQSEAKQLYAAGQVYYIAELLHLDPELQALQRSRLEATAVYLDTNLILAVLLRENRDHAVVLALVGGLPFGRAAVEI
jgi:hypothetical protein